MITNTDIDIDFADPRLALEGLANIPAILKTKKGDIQRHPSGVYFQDIPVNPLTKMAAYTYEEAEELGYFKIDFLKNSIYEGVTDENHLNALISKEPPWDFFLERSIVEQLSHINNHFGIVQSIAPQSIDDLSVILALIRPGKRYLLGRPRSEIDAEIWSPGSDTYVFRRSHAIAYAVGLVLELNLLIEKTNVLLNSTDK